MEDARKDILALTEGVNTLHLPSFSVRRMPGTESVPSSSWLYQVSASCLSSARPMLRRCEAPQLSRLVATWHQRKQWDEVASAQLRVGSTSCTSTGKHTHPY